MPAHQEGFDGGLVTARDPSLLQPGELTRAEDCMYRPNDVALYGAPGRHKLNSTSLGSAITGLKYCAFDPPNQDLLVAQIDGAYYSVNPSSGVTTSLETITGGETMDSIHYRNRHILINGVDENKVLLSDGTIRQHGMKPVTAHVDAKVTLTGGVWPLGVDAVDLYYEYWITEVYSSGDEEVESTFTGTPATVFIDDVANYVTIRFPEPVNDNATHWRVYRSISKAVDVGQAFPNGFLIADMVPRGTTSVADGLQTITAQTFPSTVTTSAGYDLIRPPNDRPFTSTVTIGTWVNQDNIKADDGTNASGQSVFTSAFTYPVAVLSGFSFGTLGSPISNIEITVQGYHSRTDGWVAFFLSPDSGDTLTFVGSSHLGTSAGAPLTVRIPATPNTWGRVWFTSELSTPFRVFMYCGQSTASGAVDTVIDYVSVKVTHGGSTASLATEFPSVTITVGPNTTAVGRHGPPPISTTGDVFEESLVLNDIANPTLISYSTQENPDSFPSVYTLSFQTKDKDTVRCIRSMGNILIVGLFGKLFRVNYLPREEDAEFDRGRAVDLISTDHGIVGPKAAAVFQMDGQPLQLAYVSRYGIHMTDGYRATTLTNDLDWVNTVVVGDLETCELVNDPENYQLVLFYEAPGGRKRLNFSYHPVHLKGGKLKVSGPVNYSANAAASASLDSGALGFFTGKSDGHVYVENSGTTDGSGGSILPVVKTRSMYLAGAGQEWKLMKGLLHHGGSGTLTHSLELEKTNAGVRPTSPVTVDALARGMTRLLFNQTGEGIAVQLAASGGDVKFNYLTVEGEGFDTEDSLA